MKAVVCTRYGPPEVLEIQEVPKPVPAASEILIRVRATTVTSGDWRIRSLEMPPGFGILARPIFGFTKPRQPILGSEVAGEVESVGARVSRFKPGDRVVAFAGTRMGCHAQFKVMAETGNVVALPEGIEFTTAAALPFGGTTAMHFLRKTGLQKGERLLVVGASGSVGSAAIQLGRHLGASVTGVCSGANVAFVRSLGAENVIDYSVEDVGSLGAEFDVVLETVGSMNLSETLRLVRPGGRAALIACGLGDLVKAPFSGRSRGIQVVVGPAEERVEDLEEIVRLTQAGAFHPAIESIDAFADIAAAHRRVQQRRKRGNIVIAVE